MKQSIRYIVFYFAVLVSLFLINSFNLKMLVVGIVAFAVVIIYGKKHCHESATSDMELLNNCRRMVNCTYATFTALLLLPIVLILSTLV